MLVNCVAYQEGHKLADIPIENISDHISKPDCFVWVALKDPGHDELELMQDEFGLHELAVEDARKGHQRPKIEEYGDSLFVVLHKLQINEAGDMELGEVNIFAGKNYILSVRNSVQQGFHDVRMRCEREPHLLKHGSGFVLYALMDNVVDSYFPLLNLLEAELEEVEERIFEKKASARLIMEDLYTLKRRLTLLHHTTAPLVEAVSKLQGGRPPEICVSMRDYYRDVYDHLLRIVKSIEASRETTSTAIQVNLTMITLSENEVTKRLASYAALFAVPTMIAGIYGMNFKSMPELSWEYGYPVAVLVMVLADIALWWKFRKAGWL